MPVRQIVQLIAYGAFLIHRHHETADFVLHAIATGAFDRHFGGWFGQQNAAALGCPFKRIEHPVRAHERADEQTDRDPEHIAGPAEIGDLGLGRHRVGNHDHAALGRLQERGAPIDIGHPPFRAVDGDPVIDLIGLGGVQDDSGKHIAKRALQGQTDNDRQGTGRRQNPLDRQIEHIGQGGDDRDQENHRAEQVLE
ncbi:hypothetical protein D3C73_433330 [compost metagenome]